MSNDNTTSRIRRLAANSVVSDDNVFEPGVVEIESGRVVAYYKLEAEMPNTEWLGGTIEITTSQDGVAKAYKKGFLI